jgi:hypothetical protein
MKRTALIIVVAITAAAANAATHSAWSAPISWDGPSALEGTSLNTPVVVTGFSILPNPVSSTKNIRFQIMGKPEGRAELKIFNVHGGLVQGFTLAGMGNGGAVQWRPVDKAGKPLASGVYLAKLTSGSVSLEQKFMLLK